MGSLAGAVKGLVSRRIPAADLDERDPDYIRERLPQLWLLSSLYFRGEVRGLGNVPERGGVLLVGNHSGGNITPDTIVFTLAFSTYFGVERRLPPARPQPRALDAGPVLPAQVRHRRRVARNARKALQAGAAVLVYPGGDYDVHRPSWQRNRIDFGGRKGFVRLALDEGVPIVPVVSVGGQETALFLSRGETLARVLGLDRMFRLKVLPISLALPWGLNVGDMLGHLPLPAKITVEALPPIDLRARVRPRSRRRRGLRPRRAPDAGHARGAGRRAAVPGDRMRVAASIEVSAPPELVWAQVSEPARYLHFMSGVTRWEVEGERRTGLGARYRMLLRVGSAEVGGLIEIVEFDECRDLAWTSVTGVDQRGRWRVRGREDGRTRVELRLRTASPAPGSPAGSPSSSRRRWSAATCAAASSSSSARSSTSSCARRPPPAARRAPARPSARRASPPPSRRRPRHARRSPCPRPWWP